MEKDRTVTNTLKRGNEEKSEKGKLKTCGEKRKRVRKEVKTC